MSQNVNPPSMAISRRTRSTPYSRRVAENGVKSYSVYNRTLIPACFTTPEEDYWHLKENVQLWDVTCERQVQIKGPDAAKLTQFLTPRDLRKQVIGQGVYAPIINQDGGMLSDPIILKISEDTYWLSIADSDLLLWVKGIAFGMKFDVVVTEPDVFPLAVQGPKANDLVAKVFGETVRDIKFFRFEQLEFKGVKMPVARSGYSKQGGFEIYLTDASLGEDLWDALWDAGQEFNVGPGCPNLIERLEGGLFSYGNDFTTENNLFECGFDAFCNIDGDFDYIGKEALLKIRDAGVKRKIRGVLFDGEALSACTDVWKATANDIVANENFDDEVFGGKIFEGQKFAGAVTSTTYSPSLKRQIGTAMIEIDFCKTGQKISVMTADGLREATVCDIPFKV